MKTTSFVIVFVLMTLGSLSAFAQNKGLPTTVESTAASDDSKPDMTELFGPDYKKGDIGHSFGVIKAMTVAGNLVVEHGKIHGTDIEATTTEFEVLDSADLSELIENSHVEFLVKKDHDDEYRVLSICKITTENSKCL